MNPNLQQFIFSALGTISWPGSIALLGYFVYQSIPYFKKGGNNEGTINELVDFKEVQEGNHNTDLAELLRWRREFVDPTLGRIERDVAYIKGNMNIKNGGNGNGYTNGQ